MVFHGWLGDSTGFDALVPHLNTDDATWCFLDAPGYGTAHDPGRAHSLESYAQLALDTADALGWDAVITVGHSMGAMAMQRVLLAAPSRVRAMIGVAPVPASGGGLTGERAKIFERACGERAATAHVIDASTGSRHARQWSERLADRAFASCTPAVRTGYLRQWGTGHFHRELLAAPHLGTIPLDLVVGGQDPSLTAERMNDTWLQWFPQASVHVIGEAGHYPPVEAPEHVARVINDVIATHNSRQGTLPPPTQRGEAADRA